MKISRMVSAVALIALGFVFGLFYPTDSEKVVEDTKFNEQAINAYIAAHQADIDLLVINEGFFYYDRTLIELHKQSPAKMCADLTEKFGMVLDENEIEMKIDFFSPVDSIPVWQKDLYAASARYLRNNCGQHAAKWTVGNHNWKYYKTAVKFAAVTK